MDELKNTKCPLNNFTDCIKNECAFFLCSDGITTTAPDGEKTKTEGDIFSLICGQPTCAIRVIGITSALKHLGLKFGTND